MTACSCRVQVVKGASIASALTGLPYVAGCLGPSLAVGAFTFGAGIGAVERTNTALAGAMVLGFGVLVASTLAGPAGLAVGGAALAARLQVADWGPLRPSLIGAARGETWTLPVLLNLLCFGQSVPIVVGRLGAARPRELRRAVLLGSAVPLLLCVVGPLVEHGVCPILTTAPHLPARCLPRLRPPLHRRQSAAGAA